MTPVTISGSIQYNKKFVCSHCGTPGYGSLKIQSFNTETVEEISQRLNESVSNISPVEVLHGWVIWPNSDILCNICKSLVR